MVKDQFSLYRKELLQVSVSEKYRLLINMKCAQLRSRLEKYKLITVTYSFSVVELTKILKVDNTD